MPKWEAELEEIDGELIAVCPECDGSGKSNDFPMTPLFEDYSDPDDTPAPPDCGVCCGFGRLDW